MNWKKENLINVAEIVMGQSPASSFYNNESIGMSFLQGCAEFGKTVPNTNVFSSQIKKIGKRNSILFSVRAPVGKINFADKDYCIGRGIAAITGKSINQNYLHQYFLFLKAKGYATQGSTFDSINFKELSQIQISFPLDPDEQKIIAEILKVVDLTIEQTEDIIAKKQRIKTGLMQDLLSKGIDTDGNIRSKAAHTFTEKNGIEVPEDWEVIKVSDVLSNIEQGWSPDCESDAAPSNEWGVLKTTSVTWSGYNENENKRLPDKLFPKTRYEIKDGDVLVTRGGPNSRVGVVAYVERTRNKLILSDKLYRLATNSKVMPQFLALALSNENTQRHLSNLKTGMAESQTNISQAIIRALKISLPKVWEQEKIIEQLSVFEQTIRDNRLHLSKLNLIKTGLMQDLLSGKVRVN